MKKIFILLGVMCFSSSSNAVSFDCAKASTFVERAICSDALLGKLDDALSENYKMMRESNIGDGAVSDLKSTQKKWMAERNKCADNHCLVESYKARVNAICEYPVVSGMHPTCVDTDEISVSTASALSSSSVPYIVINSESQTEPYSGVKSREVGAVTGQIEFGHNAAGGNYGIVDGKNNKFIILSYVWSLGEDAQDKLSKLQDSGVTVTAKGTLITYEDGDVIFDNADAVSIFK